MIRRDGNTESDSLPNTRLTDFSSMIEITTLGREAICKNGSEFEGIAGHKQKFALLTYIASEGPVSRDRLLGMFWPDRDAERARHSLSQALYAIRRELGGDFLTVEGDSISTRDARLDADRLEHAVEAEDWETVISLYGGPFLDQFVLSGAPEFEKWQTATRTRLARMVSRVFPKVIELQMAAGDLREALATAARWVALDPLEDEAQHIYITLLAQAGQRTTAIDQFESYRERLAKELDVEPLEGTVALVERIRAGMIPEYRPLGEQTTPLAAETSVVEREETPPPAPSREPVGTSFGRQLWERRIPHVALIYLIVVWFAMRLVGEMVFRGSLPSWALPGAAFALVLGLPLALVIAWAHSLPETSPHGPQRLRLWPHWAERVRGGQVAWFLTGIALLLAAAHQMVSGPPNPLRSVSKEQVVVFPFVVQPGDDAKAGENVASWIGTAIERTGGIRYGEGFRLGGAEIRTYTPHDYRSNAIAAGAGFWLQGQVEFYADTVEIRAQVHDVGGDSVVVRARSRGLRTEEWVTREGQKIVEQVLPGLLNAAGMASAIEEIQYRAPTDTPLAADSFLVGEQYYRRLRFGEALRAYQSAVAADSAFFEAALKGAMAASWLRDWQAAARLADVAERHSAVLQPARAQFAHGLGYYFTGVGDSAVAAFARAAELAPEWLETRVELGESYYHLVTSDAPADSLVRVMFDSVRTRNPAFYPALYHLIQIALRHGDLDRAENLMPDFRSTEPDTAMTLHAAEFMFECVRHGPDMVDWQDHARNQPRALHEAAQNLAVGGRRTECARAAYRALVIYRQPPDSAFRFGALLGLSSLLAAEGRSAELRQLIEDHTPEFARELGDIAAEAALAGLDLEPLGAARIEHLRSIIPDGVRNPRVFWNVGFWAATHDRIEETQVMADSLRARFAAADGKPLDSVLARSLDARIALARGDTAGALSILRELVPPQKDRLHNPAFLPWESRPWEAVTLAELLLSRGDYTAATEAAASLDSPARPVTDLMYLPRSLVVRLRAARAIGDGGLANDMESRLRALGRTDLMEGR